MKKVISRLWLLMMVAAMCFCMTACGSSKDSSDKSDNGNNVESDSKTDDKDEDDTKKSTAVYADMEEYLNSSAAQAAVESVKSLETEDMGIEVVTEGKNKLVYIYKYLTMAHEEGDGMTEYLQKAFETQGSTFQTSLDSMLPFIDLDEIVLEVRYVDMNDAVIFSQEYTAKK